MSARLGERLRGMLWYTGLPPMAVFVLGASAAVLTLWISGVL